MKKKNRFEQNLEAQYRKVYAALELFHKCATIIKLMKITSTQLSQPFRGNHVSRSLQLPHNTKCYISPKQKQEQATFSNNIENRVCSINDKLYYKGMFFFYI